MGAYIAKRLLLMIPTLFGIMLISFAIIQFAPGGPVERVLAQLAGTDVGATARIGGGTGGGEVGGGQAPGAGGSEGSFKYRGAQGLDPEFIKKLEEQFGFDKPAHERFFLMLKNYATFDFGQSYFRDVPVLELIKEKLPVSISLGLWLTFVSYAISIPLGVAKAVRDGSRFDVWTSAVIIVGYAIPSFLFAILLVVLFAGGSFWNIFPLRGLVSDNFADLNWWEKVLDYAWHLVLPLTALAVSSFATMTLLTKNSFLDEIKKQYVMTARAKGLTEKRVLYGHVFRNAMLIVIAGFPGAFISAFFAGSLLIEQIFSLDGLGLLGFEAAVNRDYPVVFATLYIFSLLGLFMNLITDLVYTWIDPRIDFEIAAGVTMDAGTAIDQVELKPQKPSRLSGINQRRLALFRANKRGFWSFWIFLFLFIASLLAEFIANDRPIIASYKGEILIPVFADYPESKFGGFLARTDFRDPFIQEEVNGSGWMIWPPIRYSYQTVNNELPSPAPSPPAISLSKEEACARYDKGVDDINCVFGNMNWMGTDDQGRDVIARLIYGFRISVLFGLVLTVLSSIVGVAAGAVQGYFGGWTDLLFQRFIEIWTSIPTLYLLIILAAFLTPNFWLLLGIMLLFSWTALVGVVRAEFLRGRNFEYVRAARALGLSDRKIMFKHLLPNAMVATVTFMPFILSGSVTTLTALDFLGFGLPPGSASLGELLAQGKANLQAPWLGLTGFAVVSIMLSLLVFIGEGVRDAFDPRKTFS